MIHYQGRVTFGGTAYSGVGEFKFAFVDGVGTTSYWSNDGTSVGGSEPAAAALMTVDQGVYSVMLGNPTPPLGMLQIPPVVFQSTMVYLRVWFRNAPGPFTLLSPDMRIVSVGYAMNAETVVNAAITELKLADGAVTSVKLADGAVTGDSIKSGAVTGAKISDKSVTGYDLANDIELGNPSTAGSLKVWSGASSTTPGVTLVGADGSVTARGALTIVSGGSSTSTRATLTSDSYGGLLRLHDEDENEAVSLGVRSSGSGELRLYQENGEQGVALFGDLSGGGEIQVNRADGGTGVSIKGDVGGAGYLTIRNSSTASSVITLDGQDSDGYGRITTQVLEITGGSDLSENFDVTSQNDTPKPGMIVCIDPASPGHLIVNSKAYDRTVAGIMSGAGGVKPGMLMGQIGSIANGKYPIALTGRVYCLADASNGPIQPGDLLTTSEMLGHAMKVTDHARAQGAIIGKAMSRLDERTGLVLVLVSLQ